jgi:DNA-directed RNA polymerase subunit RPC12/RpoP
VSQPASQNFVILKSLRPGWWLVMCSPALNGILGRFQPARLSPPDGGYLLTESDRPAFLRFAQHNGIEVRTEAFGAPAADPTMPRRPLPECAECGAPRQRHPRHADCPGRGCTAELPPPAFCEECGAAWAEIEFAEEQSEARKIRCPGCGVRQRRVKPFCSRCGADLGAALVILAEAKARERGGEPIEYEQEGFAGVLTWIAGRKVTPEQAAINARGIAACREALAEAERARRAAAES